MVEHLRFLTEPTVAICILVDLIPERKLDALAVQGILFALFQTFLGCLHILKHNYSASLMSPLLIIEEYLQLFCLTPPLNKLLHLALVGIIAKPLKEYNWWLFKVCCSCTKGSPLFSDI